MWLTTSALEKIVTHTSTKRSAPTQSSQIKLRSSVVWGKDGLTARSSALFDLKLRDVERRKGIFRFGEFLMSNGWDERRAITREEDARRCQMLRLFSSWNIRHGPRYISGQPYKTRHHIEKLLFCNGFRFGEVWLRVGRGHAIRQFLSLFLLFLALWDILHFACFLSVYSRMKNHHSPFPKAATAKLLLLIPVYRVMRSLFFACVSFFLILKEKYKE